MNESSHEQVGAAETLPKAQDVAREKIKLDPQPLTAAFWTALRGTPEQRRHLPPEILRDAKAVVVTPQTVEAIIWDTGVELCPADVRERLPDREAYMRAIVKTLEDY